MKDTRCTAKDIKREQFTNNATEPSQVDDGHLIIIDACEACARELVALLTPHGFRIRYAAKTHQP